MWIAALEEHPVTGQVPAAWRELEPRGGTCGGTSRHTEASSRSLQAGGQAAIDPQIDAGDVPRGWTGEEGDGVRDLVQPADAPDGNLSEHRQDGALDLLPRRVRVAGRLSQLPP